MATSRFDATHRHRRAVLVSLALAGVVAISALALGGMSYLASPTIWGTTLFVALALFVAARARRHLSRNLLLGLPIVVGGSAAMFFGAWDYLPWATSPALWAGVLISAICGVWLVRSGRARPREVIEGLLIGLAVFGLGLVAVFAGVVFFWVVWQPI